MESAFRPNILLSYIKRPPALAALEIQLQPKIGIGHKAEIETLTRLKSVVSHVFGYRLELRLKLKLQRC
jgi:hypothetical protein